MATSTITLGETTYSEHLGPYVSVTAACSDCDYKAWTGGSPTHDWSHLIANAPTWLAALCDEVDRLRESNENLRLIANVNGDWNLKFMRLTAENAALRARLDAAEKVVEAAQEVRVLSDSQARDIDVFAAIDGPMRAALDAYGATGQETGAGE